MSGLSNVLLSLDGWASLSVLLGAHQHHPELEKLSVCHAPAGSEEEEQGFDDLLATGCSFRGRPRVVMVPGGERASLRAITAGGGLPYDGCLVSLVSSETGLLHWGRLGDLRHLRQVIPRVEPARGSLFIAHMSIYGNNH